jgi:hypothetical protein
MNGCRRQKIACLSDISVIAARIEPNRARSALKPPAIQAVRGHKIYQNHGHPLFFRGRGWVVQDYARPADELTAVFVSVAYTPALHPYEYWRERVQAPSESVISIIIYRETLKRSHGSA